MLRQLLFPRVLLRCAPPQLVLCGIFAAAPSMAAEEAATISESAEPTGPEPVFAEPERVDEAQSEPRLVFSAPTECGSTEELTRAIEDLAHTSLEEAATDYRVEAEVEALENGFAVRVEIASPSGVSQRTFEAQTCPLARDAIVVMVALLLNPDAVSEPTDAVSAAPPAEEEPRAQSRARDEDTRKVGPPWRLILGASVQIAGGYLPRPSFGFEGRIGVARGALGVELRPRAHLPQTEDIASVPGAAARFFTGGASLLGCVASPDARVVGRVCAGPDLAAMGGRSTGVSDPGRSTAWWGAVAAELGGSLRLTDGMRFEGAVGADFAPSPPMFSVDGLGVLHEVENVVLFGSLGLSWHF